jgi:hypothetical protein
LLSRRRVRWAALVAAAVAVLSMALLLGRAHLISALEGRIQRTTGHRASVGSASLRGRTVVAREVIVFGAPPFDAEPLARIERLEVRLGGARGFWSPADLLIEGVEVEYLGTGTVDNVGRMPAGSGNGAGGPSPRLRVRHGRLRGVIHPARGPRVHLRARDFSLDVGPEGARSVALEGVVAEIAGLLTASIPQLLVKSEHGAVTVQGESAALVVPGGGPLVEELTVAGSWSPRRTELTISREPGVGRPKASPRVRATFRADEQGAQLGIDAGDLALRPLHAWLDRLGVLVDGTRADLHLLASTDGARQEVPFELDLRARGLDVRTPAIDSRTWRGLGFELHASGAIEPASRRVKLQSSELEALGLRLAIEGWTELGPVPRGSWTVRTPAPLSCARILGGAPQPVREALDGLKLAGNLGLAVSVGFDAAAWDTLSLDVGLSPLCDVIAEPTALSTLLGTLKTGAAPPPGTTGLALGSYHPDFAPLARMPAHLPAAFLTAEDGRFFNHNGFDLEMIRRALAHDLEMRSFAKGGSTIVQQLAKNLFLVQSRTLARKLEETVLAWRLATLLDRKRLLEIYLNIIELGPNIRGVKQAARAYFGKEVSALRPIESAHLAALTPNPAGLARRFRDGRVDDGWLQRLYDLLGMMNRSGRLSRSDLATARAGTLTLRKI